MAGGRFLFTPKQYVWLQARQETHTINELLHLVHWRLKRPDITRHQLRATLRYYKTHPVRERLFTDKQTEWLREKYKTHTRKELLPLVRWRLKKPDITLKQLSIYMDAHSMRRGVNNLGQFNSRQVPWNKGMKFPDMKSNSSWFKKGSEPWGTRKVGSIRQQRIQGYIQVQIKTRRKKRNGKYGLWVPIGRWVWEQHNKRRIPKKHVIRILDGNPWNYDIANLVLVSRSLNTVINAQYQKFIVCSETHLIAIQSARLSMAISKVDKQRKRK